MEVQAIESSYLMGQTRSMHVTFLVLRRYTTSGSWDMQSCGHQRHHTSHSYHRKGLTNGHVGVNDYGSTAASWIDERLAANKHAEELGRETVLRVVFFRPPEAETTSN